MHILKGVQRVNHSMDQISFLQPCGWQDARDLNLPVEAAVARRRLPEAVGQSLAFRLRGFGVVAVQRGRVGLLPGSNQHDHEGQQNNKLKHCTFRVRAHSRENDGYLCVQAGWRPRWHRATGTVQLTSRSNSAHRLDANLLWRKRGGGGG